VPEFFSFIKFKYTLVFVLSGGMVEKKLKREKAEIIKYNSVLWF